MVIRAQMAQPLESWVLEIADEAAAETAGTQTASLREVPPKGRRPLLGRKQAWPESSKGGRAHVQGGKMADYYQGGI